MTKETEPVQPPAQDVPSLIPEPPADLAAVRRRTTAVLVGSQVLGGLGVATGVALAALLARDLSGSDAMAGLAMTASVVGSAMAALPMAALMARKGRRPGLVLGYLTAAVGAVVVVLAAVLEVFPLMLAGMAAFGAASAAGLQARYGAVDLAEPDRRGRAISLVVWSTTVGSVLGPNIAGPADRSVAGLGVPPMAGPFLWAAAVFLVAGAGVFLLLRPDPLLVARSLEPQAPGGAKHGTLRDGLAAVTGSSGALLAVAAVAISHAVMVSIMVMTPVDLGHHGASIELIGLVISIHIAGMYAFSPVMGRLSDRFGRPPVILLAVVLLGLAALLAGTAGHSHVRSAAGLFLLGLGWSAGLVAGSALLTDTVPQPARAAAQGLSDLVMNVAAAVGGVLAGVITATAGYSWLNASAALLLAPLAVAAVRVRARTRA
ncbi:MFS transporter [Streptomyces sp. NPDC059506]|uniref:MFS transporter n=1 Tax=Streptomyces sp. NPDC059506 TaxID=3347751 RepID=UPI0036A06115